MRRQAGRQAQDDASFCFAWPEQEVVTYCLRRNGGRDSVLPGQPASCKQHRKYTGRHHICTPSFFAAVIMWCRPVYCPWHLIATEKPPKYRAILSHSSNELLPTALFPTTSRHTRGRVVWVNQQPIGPARKLDVSPADSSLAGKYLTPHGCWEFSVSCRV